jgi:hypothetical protein
MTALSIQPTFPIFTDIDGQPLEDGYVFIGTANLNPITNPITVYWDAALTLAAAQPIRTLGGYPMNSGTPARLYVNSDYSIQVQNKNGSLIYSALAAGDRFSGVVVDISSTDVSFIQAGTGAVTRTAQAKMRDVVNASDFGVVADGNISAGTGTDNTVALQAAIDAAQGGRLEFPAGVIFYSGTLTWRNGTIYQGKGKNENGSSGTVLYFTGTSDGGRISNAVNGFTPANIHFKDIFMFSKFRTAGKATLVDIGSSYLHLSNVSIGANDYSLILDQTELFVADKCDFHCDQGPKAAVWCVNGADYTPGNSVWWTNQLVFRDCNFGGATSGTSTVGLAIDGGIDYVIDHCQFTGFDIQMRVASVKNLTVIGGEYEGFVSNWIKFASTKLNGGAPPSRTMAANVRGGFIIGGNASTYHLDFDAGSIYFIEYKANCHQVIAGGAQPININNISLFDSADNCSVDNNTGGIVLYGNYAALGFGSPNYVAYNTNNLTSESGTTPPWTPQWTGSGSNPVIGNGSITSSWARHGPIVTMSVKITMGSTTTYGSGQWSISIPIVEVTGRDWIGQVWGAQGGTIFTGSCWLQPSGTSVLLYGPTAAIQPTSPFTWGTGDILFVTLTYSTRAK